MAFGDEGSFVLDESERRRPDVPNGPTRKYMSESSLGDIVPTPAGGLTNFDQYLGQRCGALIP